MVRAKPRPTPPKIRGLRDAGLLLVRGLIDGPAAMEQADVVAGWEAEDLAGYLGNFPRFCREVLGWTPTADQAMLGERLLGNRRPIVVASANNVGKTAFFGALAWYALVVIGSQPDEDGRPEGCRLILSGPDEGTIKATVYQEILGHHARALHRGRSLPGFTSDASPLIRIGPAWGLECIIPKIRVSRTVSASGSGRHSKNMVILVEEGGGVEEQVLAAIDTMASGGDGNRVIVAINPYDASGPVYDRVSSGAYDQIELSALNHPNIVEGREVIPGAISLQIIEDRVSRETVPDDGTGPDDECFEWRGKRRRVTSMKFLAGVLGRWARMSGDKQIFRHEWIEAAFARWRVRHAAGELPLGDPDRLGVDVALSNKDKLACLPSWGLTAGQALRRFAAGERSPVVAGSPSFVATSGRLGRDIAAAVSASWPGPAIRFVGDVSGNGRVVIDPLAEFRGARNVSGVQFGGKPLEPSCAEDPIAETRRSQMIGRCMRLLELGLLDLYPDEELRRELLATTGQWEDQPATISGIRAVRSTLAVDPKEEISKRLGRSPDRMDALILSLDGGAGGGFVVGPRKS